MAILSTDLMDIQFKDAHDKDYDESEIFSKYEPDDIVRDFHLSSYQIIGREKWGRALAFKNKLLTCNHLLDEKPFLIYKTEDGLEPIPLTEIWRDAENDVAVISPPRIYAKMPSGKKISVKLRNTNYSLGDSDKIEVGDYVMIPRSPQMEWGEYFGDGKIVGKEPFGEFKKRKHLMMYDVHCTKGDSASPIIGLYDGVPHILGFHSAYLYSSDGYKVSVGVKINEYKKYL